VRPMRVPFGLLLPILLFFGTGAAAQSGCQFGLLCGLSIESWTMLTNQATGAPAGSYRIRIYVGGDGRIFRGYVNLRGSTGAICTRDGATTESDCRNGKCTNGNTLPLTMEQQRITSCTADFQSGTLVLRSSESINRTDHDNWRGSFLQITQETDAIHLSQNDNCSVDTDVRIRIEQAGATISRHNHGTSANCSIYRGNIFAP
jgi:hypothetical protein